MAFMASLDTQVVEKIIDHVRKEILTALPTRVEQLDSANVEVLRGKLHVLHYYCLQRGLDPEITNRLKAVLETSQGFWELLEDNASTFADLQGTYRMRWLDISSAVLTELEEIASGEESFRDIIINSIAIMLGWKSDTVWVDMAKEDRRLVPKTHLIRLRDELWRFICESSRNGGEMTLEKAAEIGEKMDLLLDFITAGDLPVVARIMLLAQVYLLLLRLNIGKILVILEEKSKEN